MPFLPSALTTASAGLERLLPPQPKTLRPVRLTDITNSRGGSNKLLRAVVRADLLTLVLAPPISENQQKEDF
jgi:hypothetical protein